MLILFLAVGRWQKGRDLNWYASTDESPAAISAAEARKEELRRIKEAEQDALSEALGYGPMPKRNANETPLGKKEVERAVKESAGDDEEAMGKGIGYGAFEGLKGGKGEEKEVLGGVGLDDPRPPTIRQGRPDKRPNRRSRSGDRDPSRDRRHRRSRSRDRSRERRHHRRHNEDCGRPTRHRHRSRDHQSDRRYRERPRTDEKRRDDQYRYDRRKDRSSSPKHGKYRSRERYDDGYRRR